MQSWPQREGEEESHRKLQAIELEISEFEAPAQLSFAEFNRLDQTGTLGGISADRRQTLAEQEQALAARYGDTPFRHVGHFDPGNILTERRFYWKNGLPWDGERVRSHLSPATRTASGRKV
jgi:hypothetical protein